MTDHELATMIKDAVHAIVECGIHHNARSSAALHLLHADPATDSGANAASTSGAANAAAATENQIAAALEIAVRLYSSAGFPTGMAPNTPSSTAIESERRLARAIAAAWIACKILGTTDSVYLSMDEVVSVLFAAAASGANASNAVVSFLEHRCFGAAASEVDCPILVSNGDAAATPSAGPAASPPTSGWPEAAATRDADFWATQDAWTSHARAANAADAGVAACFGSILENSDDDGDTVSLGDTCVLQCLSRTAVHSQERQRQQRLFTKKILACEAQLLLQLGFELVL